MFKAAHSTAVGSLGKIASWTPPAIRPAIGWVSLLLCLVGAVKLANVFVVVVFVHGAVAQPKQVHFVIHTGFYGGSLDIQYPAKRWGLGCMISHTGSLWPRG